MLLAAAAATAVATPDNFDKYEAEFSVLDETNMVDKLSSSDLSEQENEEQPS